VVGSRRQRGLGPGRVAGDKAGGGAGWKKETVTEAELLPPSIEVALAGNP